MWYHQHIGGERCPIVDTWWQTETGAIMITPLPGITRTKPGSATHAVPGHQRRDPDATTATTVNVGGGLLALTKPWPSMLRGIYGDTIATCKQVLEPLGSTTSISPATARSATTTATTGCSAASTMC